MSVIDLIQETEKGYKFYQNRECPFFPFEGNENACHPNSDPNTHNCLFCYCPLYFLDIEDCPEEADPRILDSGAKDCSDCLFPHKPENYEKIMEILQRELN